MRDVTCVCVAVLQELDNYCATVQAEEISAML